MAGVKQENLILALLNTYNTGKSQYYTLLNTMLSALGEFNEPEVKLAVVEIASSEDYPIDIRKKAIDNLGAFKDASVIPKILPILEKKKTMSIMIIYWIWSICLVKKKYGQNK